MCFPMKRCVTQGWVQKLVLDLPASIVIPSRLGSGATALLIDPGLTSWGKLLLLAQVAGGASPGATSGKFMG